MEHAPQEKPYLKILPAIFMGEPGWDYYVGERLELWVNELGMPKAYDYREARWLDTEEISPRLEAYAEDCIQE